MSLDSKLLKTLILVTSLSFAQLAFALYPDKPVKQIVLFAPSGATDLVLVAKVASAAFVQSETQKYGKLVKESGAKAD